MRHWTLAALGLVTLAVIALVLWNLRAGGADPAPVEAAPGAAPSPASPMTRGAGGIAVSDPNSPDFSRGAEVPAPLDDQAARTTTMENFLAGEVPRRLLEAAAGCYNTGFSYKQLEADGATIELDYMIAVKGGVASLQNVKMTRGMGKPELEDCVVEVVGETQWEVGLTTEFTQQASYGINLLALKKFSEPLPHELDAERTVDTNDEFGPLVRKRNQ